MLFLPGWNCSLEKKVAWISYNPFTSPVNLAIITSIWTLQDTFISIIINQKCWILPISLPIYTEYLKEHGSSESVTTLFWKFLEIPMTTVCRDLLLCVWYTALPFRTLYNILINVSFVTFFKNFLQIVSYLCSFTIFLLWYLFA